MFPLRSNISLRFASSMCFGFSPRGFSEESRVSEVKKTTMNSAKSQQIGHCVVSFVAINIIFFNNSSVFVFPLMKRMWFYIHIHIEGGGSVQNKLFLIPFVSGNNSEALEKINHT